MVQLLYPEKKLVAWSTIAGWYQDAVANGEVTEETIGSTPSGPMDNESMLYALEDAGLVTSTYRR